MHHFGGDPDKVYLSKSNRSNPDQVSRVRKWLEDKGFEVIEHKGGAYDESLLNTTMNMIMVGCNPIKGGFTDVGKGQYNQLRNRVNLKRHLNFYVTNLLYGNPVLRRVLPFEKLDEDNWTDGYGRLKLKMESTIRLNARGSDYIVNEKNQNVSEQADSPYPVDTVTGKKYIRRKFHLACITLFQH